MNNTKVIGYKQNNYNLDENEIKSSEPSLTNNSNGISSQRNQNPKKKNWKYFVYPILGVVLIGIVIIIVVILTPKKDPPEENRDQDDETNVINPPSTQPEEPDDIGDENLNFRDLVSKYGPIEMEKTYKINTNANDLKRIYINQRYYEDIKVSGSLTKRLVDRKTNYDIYVISETEPDEETKYSYNKIYTCSISIASECISTKDEFCLPRKLVDLNDQDYSNVRRLNKVESLENIPLPICIFNMTDNNVILSIACHKNISYSRVSSIVLDLYFFRPPGIKRIDKKAGNITITQRTEGDYEIIRETNGGICDVENSIGSFCTTDMNTTKDKNGNLIAYDELAFSNITTNEDNYYIKNKITSLSDKTKFITELNPIKYNKTLSQILPHLKEYMKVYEQFSSENFKELYYDSKGLTNLLNDKRRLSNEAKETQLIYNENLFTYGHFSGMQVLINLANNLGLNSQSMEASSGFNFDSNKTESLGYLKQNTNMSNILKDIKTISTAGSNLADKLYKGINGIFSNLTNIINTEIPSLNNLVKYKELTDIFDSTFSLDNLKEVPFEFIDESSNLVNKLEQIYKGINDGSLKKNIVILNECIYHFITQSHLLIDKIYNNLDELSYLINSPKETISVISTYYLNHTSSSYISTIEKASQILLNYYENEVELIVPKVEKQIELFENITIESIQKQLNLIKNLKQKIENRSTTNFIINGATKGEDYDKVIANLDSSNDYITKIIKLFQEKVKKEMDLKNGYFIPKYDIESNDNRFKEIINESLEASQSIENNEYIDKQFDGIMTDFRLNFSSIMNDMKNLKESKFFMNENTLHGGYFSKSELDKISSTIERQAYDILIKIKHENDLYVSTIKKNVSQFLKDNKEYLDNLMKDLEYLFSEKMDQLGEQYKNVFNKHLESINNAMDKNKELTKNYFDGMHGVLTDNNKIVKLLENTPVNKALPPGHSCLYPTYEHCWKYTRYVDLISTKSVTQLYYDKYRIFKAKYDLSKEFINDDLNSDILEEYKKAITNFKQLLQTFKNNKMSDKYPEFSELYFIDENIKKMDDFYNSLNRHISDEVFNNEYLPRLNKFMQNKNQEITDMKNYIENMHLKIKTQKTENSLKEDFCTTYKRKKTYTCNNGAVYNYTDDGYTCLESFHTNNYKNLVLPSFESDIEFEKEVTNTYKLIKQKIESYTSKINELKNIITTIESNIKKMDLCKDYFSPIQEKLNSIIAEKYSDNLIKGSYTYYKKIIDNNLENILNEVENKWNNSFEILSERIDNNFDNFKYTINELGLMSLIYDSLIYQNITNAFHDSIISHQRTEFNYTISYYYNCLIQNISSYMQSIYNQIPTNQEGFNNITDLRRKEVNDLINKLINDVKESKSQALSLERQVYVLDVSSSNFFKTNSILTQSKKNTNSCLNSKANELYKINNGKKFNEFALASRFYLENSLNGWQIEEYYKPINHNLFIYLKSEEFKNLLKNNMIFDQDDLINQLNIHFNKSDLEIKNDFLIEKEDYKEKLDHKISSIYSQGKIEEKVDSKYNSHLKTIDSQMVVSIKNYIQNILDKIKGQMANEEKRLKETATSYSNDFSTIKETIQNYKLEIYEKCKKILDNIVNDTYENIMNVIYNNYFKIFLDEYREAAYNFSLKCEKYDTLKSSYNIGTIMYEIVEELVNSYQNYTKTLIEIKKEKYIKKKYNEAKLDDIKKIIDDEISKGFSSLLEILQKRFTSNTGDDNYDFDEGIKDSINSEIETNINNINKTLINIQENVNIMGWERLDYTDEEPFATIQTKFKTFITNKISLEKKSIDKILEEIIYNNFEKVINNVILTFGKEYFERVMKYNENFRITNLYQNLKYSLVVSLQYYSSLYSTKKKYGTLTKDLKLKLYNLNDLNIIAKEKNDKILDNLEKDIDDLIKNSFNYVLQTYKDYLENDVSLEEHFTKTTINQITTKVLEMNSTLSKYYTDLLNKECKSKFIDSYTNVMNAQTNEMIQTIEDLKIKIRLKIDDLFTVDIEKVLNQTNYVMNMTLDSIKEYELYFQSFDFPDNLIAFFDSYGDNIIQGAYEGLETLINKLTKNETLSHLEQNIKIFNHNLDLTKFVEDKNNIYTEIKNNNIDKMKDAINSYGKEEYANKLNDEIYRLQSRRLRRLNGEETMIDIYEEIKEDLNEKSISQNLNKLLLKSENTFNNIKTFECFDKFNELIDKDIKKLNISYKETSQIIDNVYSQDDIYPILNEKLEILYGYALHYYNTMKDSYNSLKNYIDSSLSEIDEELNLCTNETYKTFIQKYENISKNSVPFDEEQNKNEKRDKEVKYIKSSENFEYEAIAKITSISENARFKYNLIIEGEGRMKEAKVVASVVNKIKPLKASIEFNENLPNSQCAKRSQIIDIDFNTVNYTTNLFFDSKYNIMNVSLDKDFIYEYKLQGYEIEKDENSEELCDDFLGVNFCVEGDECNEPIKTNETELKTYTIQENGEALPINNLN